jgi:hypothetical protein
MFETVITGSWMGVKIYMVLPDVLTEAPSLPVQHRKVSKRQRPAPTLNRYTRQKRCYKGVLKP